ncbi:MAG: chromate resistance protein ChrB domain-containing protein [Candidatus Omnitrophota bacterium]
MNRFIIYFKKLLINLVIVFFLFFSYFPVIPASSASNNHLYSTWDTLETDKLASIWLIKKFIDKQAEFKFFPKGELILEGIPFDVPEAELRVTHNQSTFEAIVKKYDIKDKAILEIAQVMHDIEINKWGKKLRKDTEQIDQQVQEIVTTAKNAPESIRRSVVIFDALYEKLNHGIMHNQ